jgi:hypothetical protein
MTDFNAKLALDEFKFEDKIKFAAMVLATRIT